MTGIITRDGNEERYMEIQGRPHKDGTEAGVTWLQAMDCREPPKAGCGKKRFSSRVSGQITSLLTS